MRIAGSGRGLALALAALLAACGGGKGSGSGSGSGNGGGDGSGGGTSGGGSGSGGSGSGGSDTGGGGGSGDGSGTTGGNGGGTGSGTSGGSGGGDAGSGGGSGSAGGTGGSGPGGSTACDGLMASPGAAVSRRFDTGTHSTCALGTSSANGQIALAFRTGDGSIRADLYPSDGSAQQGSVSSLYASTAGDLDVWFHPTSAGWAGMVHEGSPPPVKLRSFDATGQTRGTAADGVLWSAPDPHGGTVMIGQPWTSAAANPGPYGPPKLEWLDGSSTVTRTVTLDRNVTMLLVDWGTDHVLTLADGAAGPGASGLLARWYDGTGTPLTDWFDTGMPALHAGSLHLLVDGSIALSDGDAWRGVFRDGVAAMDAPPAWLVARPGTRLATIRNGRGYAVIAAPSDGQAPPSSFEIVAASGESCGTVALPPPPEEIGVTRSPTSLQVGQDGTVIQAEDLLGDSGVLGSGIHCEFRWWPALLR